MTWFSKPVSGSRATIDQMIAKILAGLKGSNRPKAAIVNDLQAKRVAALDRAQKYADEAAALFGAIQEIGRQ